MCILLMHHWTLERVNMNDVIVLVYGFIITLGLCCMIVGSLLGLFYHVTKIKMKELKERIDL